MITKVTVMWKVYFIQSKVQGRLCQICIGDLFSKHLSNLGIWPHTMLSNGTTKTKNSPQVASSHLIEKLKGFVSCSLIKLICVYRQMSGPFSFSLSTPKRGTKFNFFLMYDFYSSLPPLLFLAFIHSFLRVLCLSIYNVLSSFKQKYPANSLSVGTEGEMKHN